MKDYDGLKGSMGSLSSLVAAKEVESSSGTTMKVHEVGDGRVKMSSKQKAVKGQMVSSNLEKLKDVKLGHNLRLEHQEMLHKPISVF